MSIEEINSKEFYDNVSNFFLSYNTKKQKENSTKCIVSYSGVRYDDYNFWVYQLFVHSHLFVYFSLISHLEISATETAESKDVWNKYLEFLCWSANYFLSAICLIFSKAKVRVRPLIRLQSLNCSEQRNLTPSPDLLSAAGHWENFPLVKISGHILIGLNQF